MNKKGPAQSGFNVPPFDYDAWRKEQKRKQEEARKRVMLREQLTLKMEGIPKNALCPECYGMGRSKKGICKHCRGQGVVQAKASGSGASGSEASSNYALTENVVTPDARTHPNVSEASIKLPPSPETSIKLACSRCRGVGIIVHWPSLQEVPCPDCNGGKGIRE